MIFYFCCEYIL